MPDVDSDHRHIRLTVEYDGAGYAGWQRQENALSIQQVLEEALERVVHHPVRLAASGRTDAGVHARGMVACFRTSVPHPLTAFTHGVNALLPPDIAVRGADLVPAGFDPRRDAVAKHYRYTFLVSPFRSPLARLRSWHLPKEPDLRLMKRAAGAFVGRNDFASYRTTGCAALTTVREIFLCTVREDSPFIHLDVVGGGFLRNMVRMMAGTLVEVGLGKLPPDHVEKTLESPGIRAGQTAPPQGLCLERVWYAGEFSGVPWKSVRRSPA